MIVLDTHAWLWHVAAPERLSARARAAVEGADQLGVCAISCWEVAMLERRGRIALDRDVRDWVGRALGAAHVVSLALSPEIAVDAALVPGAFPGDPADRIVYATARAHGARLVTKDAALRRYDAKTTVW